MPDQFKAYIQSKITITDEQFEMISAGLISKKIKKGSILLKQGDVCSQGFFVSNGLLRAYTVDDLFKEHIIQFGPENSWISCLLYTSPSPRDRG